MHLEVLSLNQKQKVIITFPKLLNPINPIFIFAHGSGTNMETPFLTSISNEMTQNNVNVIRFNFPYVVDGKKMPNQSLILEDSWRMVIEWVQNKFEPNHLFIGGKSMGGRIATMVAKEYPDISGLIYFGYPLHPPAKFDRIRDMYLYDINKPMLFIQGTRDGFARMDLLQETIHKIRDLATIHWVEGGDHSFKVLVHSGTHYPDILKNVAEIASTWISKQITQPKKRRVTTS